MADIKLVIKIPEEDVKGICNLTNEQLQMLPVEVAETLMLIKNGTPFPKGHGRLIDADKFISEHFGKVARLVDDAPTIIEADKGEEE